MQRYPLALPVLSFLTLFAGILLELNEKTCYFSSWLIDVDFLVLFINNQPLKI